MKTILNWRKIGLLFLASKNIWYEVSFNYIVIFYIFSQVISLIFDLVI